MLLLAGFCAVLSFLIVGKKRSQKNKLTEENSDLMNSYNSTHKNYLDVVNQIATINEVNKISVNESMQKTLLKQMDEIKSEITVLETEYKKLKPLYDRKKNDEEEEERRKRRRRAAASGGGFYGGSSSSYSRSSSSSSWGGGGGGFSGGGASGSW